MGDFMVISSSTLKYPTGLDITFLDSPSFLSGVLKIGEADRSSLAFFVGGPSAGENLLKKLNMELCFSF